MTAAVKSIPRRRATYARPAGGAWDEAFRSDGGVRPHYEGVLDALDSADLAGLRDAAQDCMRRREVGFGDGIFPLDPVPRLIERDEWHRLARGAEQRGRALAAFAADVYGDRTIVAHGIVPERTIEHASGFEPSLMGVPPARAGFLAGLDLLRCQDGRLRVLEDNTRTPSGIAYAAATRAALDECFPLSAPAGGPRPADAFALLGAALVAAAPPGVASPCVAVVSDGPSNTAFWEHRQIAQRLDIPLVGPRDLARRGSTLCAWIGGRSRRVDVLLRRTDEDRLRDERGRPTWLAELLLEPVRRGTLTVVNPLGAGVADDKAVHAYVDDMVRFYLRERPLLESVPTLDLGRSGALATARARIGELVLKPRGGLGGEGIVIGPKSSADERARLLRRVADRPQAWAAQETVTMSTHPTVCGDRLEPRHVDLRPFVIGGDEVVTTAPGALTRVALVAGSLVVNSSQGGGAKDTWMAA